LRKLEKSNADDGEKILDEKAGEILELKKTKDREIRALKEQHQVEMLDAERRFDAQKKRMIEEDLPNEKREFEMELEIRLKTELEEQKRRFEEDGKRKQQVQLEELTTKLGKETLKLERE
jgi:hypothetical protein